MTLRIKTKVFFGLTFLFILVIVMGGIGAYSIVHIAAESKEVLKDNYESVQHARQMLQLLDALQPGDAAAAERFATVLEKQEKNITEAGESQLTQELKITFEKYRLRPDAASLKSMRNDLYSIIDLNMRAITQKNSRVQAKSVQLLSYMALTGMFCLILSLNLLFNFPSYIANPIHKQTAGLMENITVHKELNMAKTHFIATVSHELKTPISSIKISADLLDDKRVGETNEEQKSLIKNIKEDADRLLKLTAELLDRTQAETGKIQLQIQRAKPQEIVEYALQAVNVQAEQKKIKMEVRYTGAVETVKADKEKTAWVLVNLLSNAIRYSPANGKIIIGVQEKGNKIEFSVRDFGKGIEPQYRDKIFDRYFQVPGSDNESGTGLGLAISREFIEAQGGTIRMESEAGGGCTFIFSL